MKPENYFDTMSAEIKKAEHTLKNKFIWFPVQFEKIMVWNYKEKRIWTLGRVPNRRLIELPVMERSKLYMRLPEFIEYCLKRMEEEAGKKGMCEAAKKFKAWSEEQQEKEILTG